MGKALNWMSTQIYFYKILWTILKKPMKAMTSSPNKSVLQIIILSCDILVHCYYVIGKSLFENDAGSCYIVLNSRYYKKTQRKKKKQTKNKMSHKLILLTLLQFYYRNHGSTTMKNINEIY